MATYTIVSKDADPLGPGEIHAGDTISVSDGDVFVVDPSADANITFVAANGDPADFSIEFVDTVPASFDIKIEADLSADMTIPSGADLSGINIDTKAADEFSMTAGDGVSLGQFEGAVTGPNTITIGNGFTTDKNWKFGDSDDYLSVGDDASFHDMDTGGGDDTLLFGDRASVNNIDTKAGNDSLTFGDDLDANDVKGSDGDDTFRFGEGANVNKVDGGNDTDTVYTETDGMNESNIESSQIVCFAAGTLIRTEAGEVAVEHLAPGAMVETLDAGPVRLVWIGHFPLPRPVLLAAPRLRPIRIAAGALGAGTPACDLLVSPNHRILVQSRIAERMFDHQDVLVPAKKLVDLPGITRCDACTDLTYFHLLLDTHEIVFANGAACESMYLGAQTMKALTPAQHHTIRSRTRATHRPCRTFVDARRSITHLLARHIKNEKPLQGGLQPASKHGAPATPLPAR